MTRSNNEIPVRRREGGVPWWAWLVGLALLALAFLFLTGMLGGNRDTGGAGQSAPVSSPATSPDAASPDASTPDESDAGGESPDASGSPESSSIGRDAVTAAAPIRSATA